MSLIPGRRQWYLHLYCWRRTKWAVQWEDHYKTVVNFSLRHILLLIGLVSILYSGYSQPNLILNHSFELNDSCTSTQDNFPTVNNWGKANMTTPDYLNICNSGLVSAPTNLGGFQYPQDGDGYAGIAISDAINWRESIQGVLSQPLESNKYYCFEIYISVADTFPMILDRLGVYFDNDSIIPTDFTNTNNSLSNQTGNICRKCY